MEVRRHHRRLVNAWRTDLISAPPTAPRRVVVVGGGSAGWMAASYLGRALPASDITLIESPRVSTIGVGEGTIPALRGFLRSLGIEDDDLIRHANATFKLGIRFEDWNRRGTWWWHPFFCRHGDYPEEAIIDGWLASGNDSAERLSDLSMSWKLAAQGAAPRVPNEKTTLDEWQPEYATHFDASLFADLLRERFVGPGGIRHVVDHVTDVCVENGAVTAVVTESGCRVEGDFFVDCTGFRRLLMEQVSDAAFASFSSELPCDRAVTVAIESGHLRPYTTATALSAGWAWQIDLSHRTGIGYVYSSQHLTQDAAEAEVRAFASTALDVSPQDVAQVPANHLGFTAGHLRRPLVANCVAIGLAEGFVEPLEATSLGMTAKHIADLGVLLAGGRWADETVAAGYNEAVAIAHCDIKDFLLAHYCFTDRTDTVFWREIAEHRPAMQRVAAHRSVSQGGAVFCSHSWRCLAEAFELAQTDAVGSHDDGTPRLTSLDLRDASELQRSSIADFVAQRTYLQAVRSASNSASGHSYRAAKLDIAGSLAAKLNGLDLTAAETALLGAVISDSALLPS